MGISQNRDDKQKKRLIKFLLEDDIKCYKDFINEIDKFKKLDLENLFSGNYQSKFPVKNSKSFQDLVKRFYCYSPIIKEWYNDETKYNYIKKLWKKRNDLKRILLGPNLETNINSFLKRLEFPENIIDETTNLLLNSDFNIAIKIEENMKKEYPGIADLLDRINNLKLESSKNIKYNYESDTFFDILKENADIIIGEIWNLFPLSGKIIGIICERIQNNSLKENKNGDLGKIVIDIKNLKKKEKDKPKKFTIFSFALKFLEFCGLVSSLSKIPNQIETLKNILDENEYNKIKKELDKIQNNIKSHIKMNKLTDNFEIDYKILDEKTRNLEIDFYQIKHIIENIDQKLQLLHKNRNRNIISCIFNGIGIGLNIGLMIAGQPSFSNIVDIGLRGINMACNIDTIIKCQSFIDKYKELLKKAENQRDEIKNCIKECEKEFCTKYKEKLFGN